MNTKKQYLINELFSCTNELYSLLAPQAPYEEIYFLPVGILLMKWICDSKERFNWNVLEQLEDIFANSLYNRELFSNERCSKILYKLAEELEANNPILNGIFTSLCFAYIDYIKPEYLRSIITTYSKVQFGNKHTEKDITGPFMELFLQKISNYSSFYSFITPKSVKEILAKLFHIYEHMHLADITAGVCGILAEVVNECNDNELDIGKIKLYGQEINYKIALIGKLNLLLHGIKKPDVIIKDSLKESILNERNNITAFDVILSNLPLGLNWNAKDIGYSDDFKYDYPNKMFADWLFIQRGLAALEDKGKAAFIVSKGTLTRNNEMSIRKNILMDDLIEAVISLPGNLYGSKTMPIEILIINKNKELAKEHKVLFIDASKEYYKKERGKNNLTSEHIDKILNVYHKWSEIDNYSKIMDISMLEKNSFVLDSSLYINYKELLPKQGKMKRLKDVADIKRGLQIQKDEIDKLADIEGTHYYIKISDINNGMIEFNEKINGLSDSKISLYELRPKDIIISARGTLVKTAIYEDHMPPSIISGNIMLIRVKKEYNPYFLKFYLDSSKGKELIQDMQGRATITALNHSKLQELLVPDIDKDKQNQLAERIIANEENYKSIIEHATKMYEQNVDTISKEIFYNIAISSNICKRS